MERRGTCPESISLNNLACLINGHEWHGEFDANDLSLQASLATGFKVLYDSKAICYWCKERIFWSYKNPSRPRWQTSKEING